MKKDLEPPRRVAGMTPEQFERFLNRFTSAQQMMILRQLRGRWRRGFGKDGGALPQPADPNRPNSGQGGAAAALDFD